MTDDVIYRGCLFTVSLWVMLTIATVHIAYKTVHVFAIISARCSQFCMRQYAPRLENGSSIKCQLTFDQTSTSYQSLRERIDCNVYTLVYICRPHMATKYQVHYARFRVRCLNSDDKILSALTRKSLIKHGDFGSYTHRKGIVNTWCHAMPPEGGRLMRL